MSTYEGIPTVNAEQWAAICRWAIEAPEPIAVLGLGDPGNGKTQIARDVIAASGVEHHKGIYSALVFTPEDGAGLPDIRGEVTRHIRPGALPPADRKTVVLCDEIDKPEVTVINVVSTLITECRINDHAIHPDTRWILTANVPEARTGGREIPSHLRDRCAVFHVASGAQGFLRWAQGTGIDPRVIAFIRYTQSTGEHNYFSAFDARKTVSPSPRSWERVSRILAGRPADPVPGVLEAMIEGSVGPAAANAFVGFLRIALSLPTADAIVRDPAGAPLPTEAAALHAAVSMLAAEITPANASPILAYLQRVIDAGHAEFGAFFAVELEARESTVRATGDFVRWATANPTVLPS